VRRAISPGQIVTLKGLAMGPAEGVELELTPEGNVATTLAGTRVFFDEFAAPILYTSDAQINAVVPYEVAGRNTVQVTTEYQGVRSPAVTYQVAATSPGIFTIPPTGQGQGAILNEDFSINGLNAAAEQGSIIQVFATGEGVTEPPLATGSVTSGFHNPVAQVVATIGGRSADVIFAGAAPGAVAGLFQANIRVPVGIATGNVPILLIINGVGSQPGVTVAVR
jgi:uncharacterized protein (TIGR03437 family)